MPLFDEYDSGLERDWASVLEGRRLSGLIREWWYHPFTLHLSKGKRYTPDFLVVELDESGTIHEVKGTVFRRGAANAASQRGTAGKWLHAADKYKTLWRFVWVTRTKGVWSEAPDPYHVGEA